MNPRSNVGAALNIIYPRNSALKAVFSPHNTLSSSFNLVLFCLKFYVCPASRFLSTDISFQPTLFKPSLCRAFPRIRFQCAALPVTTVCVSHTALFNQDGTAGQWHSRPVIPYYEYSALQTHLTQPPTIQLVLSLWLYCPSLHVYVHHVVTHGSWLNLLRI